MEERNRESGSEWEGTDNLFRTKLVPWTDMRSSTCRVHYLEQGWRDQHSSMVIEQDRSRGARGGEHCTAPTLLWSAWEPSVLRSRGCAGFGYIEWASDPSVKPARSINGCKMLVAQLEVGWRRAEQTTNGRVKRWDASPWPSWQPDWSP